MQGGGGGSQKLFISHKVIYEQHFCLSMDDSNNHNIELSGQTWKNCNFWGTFIRWIIGFFTPLLFMTLPSVFHLNYKLLRQEKRAVAISDCRKRRETSLLQHYLRFCLSIMWIDILLRIPSFIHDISLWTTGDEILKTVPSVSYKFVLYILTGIVGFIKEKLLANSG